MPDSQEPVAEHAQQEKVFTQEQVNNLIAKETKKALEKTLKELGVEDFDSAKEGLTKFKEIQDSQKSEQEKLLEATKKLKEENEKALKDNQDAMEQIALLSAGIPKDKLKKYSKLAKASEGETFEQQIAVALEEFPLSVAPPSLGAKTEGKEIQNKEEETLNSLRDIAKTV